jgi:hypothetical protein
MKLRDLGLTTALLIALLPQPAQAQGDFVKGKIKELIERAGIYVSASTRTALDEEVDMGPSLGIGFGLAGKQTAGRKIPFSFSSYSGALDAGDDNRFGRISAKQLMTGIGYSWTHGKWVYGGQLGVGYSFNKVTLDPGVALAFGVPEPVAVDVSNSFVVRPQLKAEYFLHRKMSLRTQLSYTYTDPDVIIRTVAGDVAHDWNPNHFQLSFAVGIFPLRK